MRRGRRRLSTGHTSPGAGGYKLSHPAFLQALFKCIPGGLCRLGCARHPLLGMFSSFCVFRSNCALSAIKCQTPIPQFPLNITLPLQGSHGSRLCYSWHRHLIQGYLNFILSELLSVSTSICALNCASGSCKWWWGC